MARKADTPCARCGTLLWRGPTSLPAGKITCRSCRSAMAREKPKKATPSTGVPCPLCAAPIVTAGARTCSRLCGQRLRHRGHVPKGRTCEVCAAIYRPTYPGQRTCGRACGVELRRSSPSIRRCIRCAKSFESTAPGRVNFCSPECRSPKPSTQCFACGKTHDPAGTEPSGSDACRAELKRRVNAAFVAMRRPCVCGAVLGCARNKCDACVASSKRAAKRRRRAHKRGALSERYTLAEIARRDRFRCHICRQRVAMTKVVPDPHAPTIDHLVPLSAGGDDVRSNVRLACFICNSTKGAGTVPGGEQLLLFG